MKNLGSNPLISFCKNAVLGSLMLLWIMSSCNSLSNNSAGKMFILLPASETGIAFSNDLTYTEEVNPYTFRNFFNGGGVAIGDINNDGLADLFFCSNQQSNKLYLNKGNFKFQDISQAAGVASKEVWSTGVTMADINGDGWLDIYVCKSAALKGENRSNELFINNGDLTFTEKSKVYGLTNYGLSTHAAFFDYDNDGDLDCYLLNNSFRSVGNYDLLKDQRNLPDSFGGNKLFRNDEKHFIDVTNQAGIYSSQVGFGLGVTIADINRDGWQDIYVSNDFFEKDYLYINQQNGRYHESVNSYIRELSMNSMGADIADINNDGYSEIYVTDMFPDREGRVKTKTVFENWEKYQSGVENGYYHQFVRNTLQVNSTPLPTARKNNPEVFFSEIGRFSGVHATDWSWGALITDLDNDGLKDIYVANGIYKDITDQDYIQYTANAASSIREQVINKEKNIIKKLIDLIPSQPLSNYAFRNNGDLTFSNHADAWGLATPGFSNGAAYGDLDNDGDLDLVVNNVNMPCFIYRNQSRELHPENNFLQVTLSGEGMNRFGIGSKVTVYHDRGIAYQEQMPVRGFQSTVDCRLNFGLGRATRVDSVVIEWPGGKHSAVTGVALNSHLLVKQQEAAGSKPLHRAQETSMLPLFQTEKDNQGLDFEHRENPFVDFNRDPLIYHMLSTDGPRIAKGDLNGDGVEDIYICGAKDQPGGLYVQGKRGRFHKTNEAVFEADRISEDTDALFFDADGDGDQDLFVCSGGNEFSPNSTALISRLYINDGRGRLSKSPQVLPSYIFESSSCVSAADYDGDGDLDLFTGVRLKPFSYGYACNGYLLQNDGKGIFSDVTRRDAPGLLATGMITDGEWLDYDRDGKADLVIAGEYMPIKVFHNEAGKLREVTAGAGLAKSNGWWNRIVIADLNADGYPDIVAANHGLNSRFRASETKPVTMYVSDFDNNGGVEQIICCYNGDKSYPMALRHDLVGVIPALKKKYLTYEQYKEQTIQDIFTADQLSKALRLDAYTMHSSVMINNGKGGFTIKALPVAAQLSPMYGIAVDDFDGDGNTDILMGGNFYGSKPEVGIYDASYGVLLKGNGKGNFISIEPKASGLDIKGQVRDITTIKINNKPVIIIARNNDSLLVISQNIENSKETATKFNRSERRRY